MFVIIYALLGFLQASLQICYNVEHFSDIFFSLKIFVLIYYFSRKTDFMKSIVTEL